MCVQLETRYKACVKECFSQYCRKKFKYVIITPERVIIIPWSASSEKGTLRLR